MHLDRAEADAESPGHVLVREAEHHALHHLALTRRQGVDGGFGAFRGAAHLQLPDLGRGAPERGYKHVEGHRATQEIGRAETDCGNGILLVESGKEEDGREAQRPRARLLAQRLRAGAGCGESTSTQPGESSGSAAAKSWAVEKGLAAKWAAVRSLVRPILRLRSDSTM